MKRSLPLNALRVFELAAQHLSFTKAGEELSLTAAAVSQQVKLLESWLGMPLFVRSNNRLSLTPAGENYFPRIREGFRALQHATDQLLDHQNASLRVLVPPTFGTKWLVPRLFRFFDRYPDIGVEVVTDGQPDASGWDIAIDDRLSEGSDQVLLVSTGYTPVCSPALAGGLHGPSDLAAHTLLHERQNRRAAPSPGWDQWLARGGMDLGDVSREMGFGDGTMMLQAAIEGQGVALAQELLVAYDVAAGRLVQPFQMDVPLRHAYYLCVARDAQGRPETDIFREWLFAEVA
ncbi:LysR family glycine cleavage system transcriptional activator [Luteibacter sp. Sphag1AF]|uniref:LysR substrate-binding domain-containing protein n=1 Tax=Luteibacter sp. Sphag1AF TaxID=2587031 RepID=UPI0016144DFE|nr:LysR substrate-binding domain-containing protein [Luteibacter sp. Sphag1AF]MBB3226245.1 LysR family glycine cleavage system transcriptional activator [Luteibacter sp. Sphag1AF]